MLTTTHVTIGKWKLMFPRRTLMSPGSNPLLPPSRGPSHHTNAPSTTNTNPTMTIIRPIPCMEPEREARTGLTKAGPCWVRLPVLIALLGFLANGSVQARQPTARAYTAELGTAMAARDEAAIQSIVARAREALGERAGIPEVPDMPRPAAIGDSTSLTPDEIESGFNRILRTLRERKWWHTGLDPRQTEHLPREVATFIEGCVAGCRARSIHRAQLLAEAIEAGDYLLWTQREAGTGVFPFPAFEGGKGAAFEAATRFLQRAREAGRLEQVTRNGWVIDDLNDGGLQFDNALCGVALLELFEFTRDERFRKGALDAAGWAMRRPCVPNWNYNSFSVHLLARIHNHSHDPRHLAAALEKARLGVLPGQLNSGPRTGRWLDPHNARPAYHYILVRGLLSLLPELPPDSPDRAVVALAIRNGFAARNPDFARSGILNVDSAMEALLLNRNLSAELGSLIGPCATQEAWDILERHCVARLRRDQAPFSPGVAGRFLEFQPRSRPTRPGVQP